MPRGMLQARDHCIPTGRWAHLLLDGQLQNCLCLRPAGDVAVLEYGRWWCSLIHCDGLVRF